MARALTLGFLVGFPIAASPGPIFVLVLRRTLARGWRSGLISGLGVATGDAIYAALAAFGVAAVTNVLVAERRWISLAGGFGLIAIGLRTISAKTPHPDPPPQGGRVLAVTYLSMVALTLSNPPTILSFSAVFAGLGLRVDAGWLPAIALVAGVMLGSAMWWVMMAGLVSLVRERRTPSIIRGIHIISGIGLAGFGIWISLESL